MTMQYELYGKTYDVRLVVSKYYFHDNIALKLETPDGLPFAHITVNLQPLVWGYAYLDTNNLPNIREFIERYKIGKWVNAYCESGYCKYPLYKIDLDRCRMLGAEFNVS